jgi:molybdate transport system ATP-binding protein
MITFDCLLQRPDFRFEAAFEAGAGITALFGPSGSGKSTAIRLIAGLERADRGRIAVDGTMVLDTAAGLDMPPHARRIGLVFQETLLFPHMSVKANLTYGRWFTPRNERRIAFDAVVDVLGIGHLLARRPATLSGGERQRVAIGRAMLASPRLLLMDEPLAALDEARKVEILPFIERLRDEFALPILYVSHAVEEVMRLASRVVLFEAGRVAASGTPAEVMAPAALGSTANRLAALSVVTGTVARHRADDAVAGLVHPAGTLTLPGLVGTPGETLRVAIRAADVALAVGHPGQVSVRTQLSGTIAAIDAGAGAAAIVTIALEGGERLIASATRLALADLGLDVGDRVTALVKSVAIDERGLSHLR